MGALGGWGTSFPRDVEHGLIFTAEMAVGGSTMKTSNMTFVQKLILSGLLLALTFANGWSAIEI